MLSFKKLAGGVLAAVTLVCFGVSALAGANTSPSAWITNNGLALTKLADVSNVPPEAAKNTDCLFDTSNVCSYGTAYGFANSLGQVKLGSANDYLPVYGYMDNRQHFLAVPGSAQAITYTTDPVYGAYLYFNSNFTSSIKRLNSGGSYYYQMTAAPESKLTDKSGHKLAADLTSLAFSQNGEWMVLSIPNVAMARVNLQTMEVLPFAPGFSYSIGLSPAPVTSITNDGRYAVVASKDFNRFGLYDLSTCAPAPDSIAGPVNCQSRDLQSYLGGQLNGFSAPSGIRFINDDSLTFYARATPQISRFMLSTTPGPVHQQDYLALGDSYISGEGAFNYLPGTDTADNQCHVSSLSYPLLIGKDLNFNSYHSVSCSGATTNDIIDSAGSYSGQVLNNPNRTELEKSGAIQNHLAGFQQGYIDQLDFVKQYQPQAITVSIGGNDIGFSARLQQCLGEGTCYNTYEDRLEFVREVNRSYTKFLDTYTKLRAAGPDDMRIYVIGYPQIAKAGGDCALNVHMNKTELEFAQQAIDYLNKVIQAAAARAGAFYVDTQHSLDGHRLCEAKPGSVAVNGITAGNDFPDWLGGPIGRESYHPNDFGHLLLENTVRSATKELTAPMPAADPTAALPAESGLQILNIPASGRSTSATEYDNNLAPDLIYRGAAASIVISGAGHALPPNIQASLVLHSTPITLSSLTTDSLGNLLNQVAIPDYVPIGYHTLHLYGTDISGQPVDIFKTVYIAATADDKDGDGVADITQKCVGVTAANVDYDQDGIDDACDPNITLASTAPAGAQSEFDLSSGDNSIVTAVADQTPASSKDGSDENNEAIIKPQVLAATTNKSRKPIKRPNYFFLAAASGFVAFVALFYLVRK